VRAHVSCHAPEHRQDSTEASVQRGHFPKLTKFHDVRSNEIASRLPIYGEVSPGYGTILTNLG
jgi:hypothetical protein